jgi:ribosomal protein L3 glutamine methyltransferase
MVVQQAGCAPAGSGQTFVIDKVETVEEVIRAGAALLEAAHLSFGHGTDNALDDAAELVFFAAQLRHEDAPQVYARVLTPEQRSAVRYLIERRISERIPTAYLTHRMWFAGHEFYVDERVLVPRSPIAELIESAFIPWAEPERVRSLADIGTGSGCIAIAAALALPQATVDAVDVSPAALAVTQINCERHGVADRVRGVLSDVYANLGGQRYDIIVSNPPYVSTAEMTALPQEYLREPDLGLRAGADGLDVVRRLLAGAAEHMEKDGILIVETGDAEEALVDACPTVPFTWLEFERGGGGVFLLTEREVREHDRTLKQLLTG